MLVIVGVGGWIIFERRDVLEGCSVDDYLRSKGLKRPEYLPCMLYINV